MICGIDEAGRGPILGPLVICGVLTTPEQEKHLTSLGVCDSKLLTAAKREALYDAILELVEGYHTIFISPQEIDSVLTSATSNLNWLEADKTAEILSVLKPAQAFIDCPSPNLELYRDYLRSKLTALLTSLHTSSAVQIKLPLLRTMHKAERHSVAVAAASILAKVQRDRTIQKEIKRVGIDFGSGYLSDPKTQAFFESNWSCFPQLFRTSWAPYKKKMSEAAQSSLAAFGH